jgi:hypothetical protein
MLPELSASRAKALMARPMNTYSKVIITWKPKDKLPSFPPRVEQVQHPFMVNMTVIPNTQLCKVKIFSPCYNNIQIDLTIFVRTFIFLL